MLSTRSVHLVTDTPYHPTKNRNENAYHVKHLGKSVTQTPFQPKTAQSQRFILGSTKLTTRTSKPLADKTPFTNRVLNTYNTPSPNNQPLKPFKLPTTTLEVPNNPTPESGPGSARASSTRKHSRVPKGLGANFQTPANSGHFWDVSEDDIVVPEMEQPAETELEEALELNDEIEYMPPNTLNLEYQPPIDFDLPNYKLLGQAALRSVYSYPYASEDQLPPPLFDFNIEDNEFMKWDDLSLPSLSSDDEFTKTSKPGVPIRTHSKHSSINTVKPSSSRATSTAASRPATSASTRRPVVSSITVKSNSRSTTTTTTTRLTNTSRTTTTSTIRKPASTTTNSKPIPRPATSTNIKRPTTTIRPSPVTTRPATSASISRFTTSTSIRNHVATKSASGAKLAVTRKPVGNTPSSAVGAKTGTGIKTSAPMTTKKMPVSRTRAGTVS